MGETPACGLVFSVEILEDEAAAAMLSSHKGWVSSGALRAG